MKFGELAMTVLASVGQLVGVRAGTEQPHYTVIERFGAVEIRHYGSRLAAEAVVTGQAEEARNAGFRKVAGYIFGGNTTRASIAMTAPVIQAGASQTIAMTAPVVQTLDGDGAWRVQFIMPARYTRATLPIPSDPGVRIVELPAQDFAVLRFSGSRSGTAVFQRSKELTSTVVGRNWRVAGPTTSWFYDPPWTPSFLRRNEVAVPVTR